MNICGKLVTLRAVEAADVAALHRWSNDPDVQQGLGGWHFPLSMASLQAWVSSFRHDALDQRMIIEAAEGRAIGLITLTSINWKDRNAFHGVLIGEKDAQRKGLATDAVLAVMRYAFEELALQRLDTTIVEYNVASVALHVDKCGWRLEGRKEQAVFRNNRYWANLVLGVTRDEYGRASKAPRAGAASPLR